MSKEMAAIQQIKNDIKNIPTVISNRSLTSTSQLSPSVTDGVNTLIDYDINHYLDPVEWEFLTETPILVESSEFLRYRYTSSNALRISAGVTVSVSRSTEAIQTGTFSVLGTLSVLANGAFTSGTRAYAGYTGVDIDAVGGLGTNGEVATLNVFPIGGSGGTTPYFPNVYLGAPGASRGGNAHHSANNGDGQGAYSGHGGGNIFIICDTLEGNGTLEAKGGNAPANGQYGDAGGGGGGVITVLTKTYSGETVFSVAGGSGTGGYTGGTGSYAIWRINNDGTLTLMVHSDRGSSADLNGQTPVHGADASIAW